MVMFLPKEIAAAWAPQTRCIQRRGLRVELLALFDAGAVQPIPGQAHPWAGMCQFGTSIDMFRAQL